MRTPRHRFLYAVVAVVMGFGGFTASAVRQPGFRGTQFLSLTNFTGFAQTAPDGTNGGVLLTSPELISAFPFDEMILSWNVVLPADGFFAAQARALYDEHATKWFQLGRWSDNPKVHPRESVLHQADADGDVDTDTLKLKRPARRFQVRFSCGAAVPPSEIVRRIGICLTDTQWRGPSLPPNRLAWGKSLDVPERSQMSYPNGGVLCSPTTVSMLLSYWSRQLRRPDLDKDVPEIVEAVFDANWHGTGNWVFNMAYAGSLPGMTACVTRMSDVAELEDLVAEGVPVGLSLCYNRLRGKSRDPSGHLVVCVGFTADGDPIINDPGTSKNVRKVFPRKNLVDAWAYSGNAAYLVAPEGKLPTSRFGHW